MFKCKAAPKPSVKREAILDAAREVFLEQGYASASMDTVASRAGVSKATIYAHFDSKDELFGAMIQRRCELNATFDPIDSNLSAAATLTMIGQRLLSMLLQPDTLAVYRVVVSEAARHPDLARAFYESGPGKGKTQIAAMLSELDRRGELTIPDAWTAADQFVGLLRTDLFMRSLLGLPQQEGRTVAGAIAGAVEIMLRAYAKK